MILLVQISGLRTLLKIEIKQVMIILERITGLRAPQRVGIKIEKISGMGTQQVMEINLVMITLEKIPGLPTLRRIGIKLEKISGLGTEKIIEINSVANLDHEKGISYQKREVIILYSDAIAAAAKEAKFKSCSGCHALVFVFVCLGAWAGYFFCFSCFIWGEGKSEEDSTIQKTLS